MPEKKLAKKTTKAAVSKKTPAKKVSSRKETVSSASVMPKSMPQLSKDQVFATLKRPQVFIPLAILVAILLVFFLRSWFVVALVNGQFISRSAFESAMEKQAGKTTLNTLVTQALVEQEAAKKGIQVNQSDIDNQAKQIDKQLSTQGQTLDQALAARGMTRDDFNEQLKLQDLLQKLLADQIKVSDKDVQDYIDKNKDSLPTDQSADQLKASVRQQLEQQKLSTAAQGLVQKLQQQAKITYFINL